MAERLSGKVWSRESVEGDEGVSVAFDSVCGWRNTDGAAAKLDGVLLDRLDAHVAVDGAEDGNREAVDDDGKQRQPVDDRTHSAEHVNDLVIANRFCFRQLGEKMAGVLDVESSTNTDWTKIAHKEGLLPIFDGVRHQLVGHQNCGDPTEQEDKSAQAEEPTGADPGNIRVELAPWDDGAKVHEATEVEQNVDTGVDLIVSLLRFS